LGLPEELTEEEKEEERRKEREKAEEEAKRKLPVKPVAGEDDSVSLLTPVFCTPGLHFWSQASSQM